MSLDKALAMAQKNPWQRFIKSAPPPLDAGATMLGAFGLRNPIITWLLNRYPFLLDLTPKQIVNGLRQPTCREWLGDHSCRRPMFLDLRDDVLYWHCTLHPAKAERVTLPVAQAMRTPSMPLRKMVAATAAGKTLEWQPDSYGEFRVVEAAR